MSQQINLFDPRLRTQKAPFMAATMAQMLAFIVIGMAIFYAYSRYQVGVLAVQAADFDRQLKAGLEQVKLLSEPEKKGPEDKVVDDRIAKLEAQVSANQQLATRMGRGGATKSYSEYLRALARQPVPGVWLTSVVIAGDSGDLSLEGRALRSELVPQYIEQLRRDDALRGLQFGTLSIETTPGGQAEFKLLSSETERK